MSDNKVYIITHKICELPNIDGYIPLAVGCKGKEFPDNYFRDDMNDNMSLYNDSYSEQTGLYWIWKNTNHSKVGLVHYRRYFVDIKDTFMFKGRYIYLSKKNKYHILDVDELDNILGNSDVIVKESDEKKITNEELFSTFVGQQGWEDVKSIIYSDYKEYISAFDRLSQKKKHINCNMFYGKKQIMDKYCEWVFEVSEKVDNIHIKATGERYHNREIGYFAEFFFGLWLDANEIDYKVVPVINIGDDYAMHGVLNIFQFLRFMIIKPLNHIFGLNIK